MSAAFGGALLLGDSLMRLIYADDTGTEPRSPLALVCAVVVRPDSYWLAAEADIEKLKESVPSQYREGFVFRASDMLTKRDRPYDPKIWPLAERVKLLGRLVSLPCKHRLMVAYGFCENLKIQNQGPHFSAIACHVFAYVRLILAVDGWFVDSAGDDEIGILFVEDTQAARRAITKAHDELKGAPERVKHLFDGAEPVKRIKDAVNFVEKNKAPFLQLADGCGSVLRRALSNVPDNDWLLSQFLGGLPRPTELFKAEDVAAGGACVSFLQKVSPSGFHRASGKQAT